MKVIEISANNNMSYYVNASEIEAVEISYEKNVEVVKGEIVNNLIYSAVIFLKSGKIIFDNELFPDKKEIFKKYFQGE